MDPTQEAIARKQIEAVMHHYAWHAREKADWDEIASCFEPTGIFRLSDGRELPPSRAKEVVRGNEAKFIRHHITTVDIKFTSEVEAQTGALFFASTEYTPMDHWGCWKDTFRRQEDGRWLIRDRSIRVEGKDPNGWSAKVYGELKPGGLHGAPEQK